ncbi:MAG: cobalamin biosynthesis protein [Actinomycetota bacterium]
MTASTALGLISGYVADALVGDPVRGHPVAAFGRAASALERALWRHSRGAGTAYVLALVFPVTTAAAALDAALRRRPFTRLVFVSIVTWVVLGGRSLSREAHRLADAVARGDLTEARRIAPSLMGRDPADLDGPELCRAAVESVAENTADAVVGALLWGAVAGPAGAVAYRAANTLDAMVGHRSERHERFGWAAARLDDVLTWPAARLGALIAVVLAPTIGGRVREARRILLRDGRRHPSPNAGLMEAAFAGALGVQLGGTNRYGTRVETRPRIGEGFAPDVRSVRRAVRLSEGVAAAAAGMCVLLAWRRGR